MCAAMEVQQGAAPQSGMDLKVQRTRLRVSATALARAAGWAYHTRVSQIEALEVVPPESLRRYLDALATIASGAAPEEGV